MKRSMAFNLLLLALLLVGCAQQGGQPYKDVNYQTGTEGVTLELVENAPAKIIDEESTFSIRALVQNKGAYDLNDPQAVYVTIIKDNFFIQGTTEGYAAPFSIRGKSDAYPQGQFYTLDLGMYKASTIPGNFEKPETNLVVTACYPYQTKLTQDVCIDVNKLNQRRQPCTADKPLAFSGQGAPVVITKVEPEMQQLQGGFARPTFKIYIENKGKGEVISPFPSEKEASELCTLQNTERKEIERVQIKAYLSDLQLDCGLEGVPDYVDIGTKQNWISCYVTDDQLRTEASRFGNRDNYKTSLSVELFYYYLITDEQKIGFKHVQRFETPDESLDLGEECLPWQVPIGGECINKCDYCGDASIEPKPDFCTSKPILGRTYPITDGFGCGCDQKTFEQLFKIETSYFDDHVKAFKPFKLAVPGDFCPDDYGCCKPVDCRNLEKDPTGCKNRPQCTYCPKQTDTGKASCINSEKSSVEDMSAEERSEYICKPLCGERSYYNQAMKTCEKPPKETETKKETESP